MSHHPNPIISIDDIRDVIHSMTIIGNAYFQTADRLKVMSVHAVLPMQEVRFGWMAIHTEKAPMWYRSLGVTNDMMLRIMWETFIITVDL